MVYVTGNNNGKDGTLPSSTSSTTTTNTYASTYYSNSSTSHYYPNINATNASNMNNMAMNMNITPDNNLGLRKRDGIAILTCLFLLRLAFTPSDTIPVGMMGTTTLGGGGSGGLLNFADSSISASMELAFYSPFQSNPPNIDTKNSNWTEKTARPVPLDIDGDGIVEAMVVPVFLKREDVAMVISHELEGGKSKQYTDHDNNKDANNNKLSGWSNDGSWGLRVLNLKPLHRRDENNNNEEGVIAGPFAPRNMFLAPLLPFSTKQQQENPDVNNNDAASKIPSTTTYPLKLLSIQIPIQRTQLGEEEKSRQRHKKENSSGSSGGGTFGAGSGPPPKDDPNHKNYDRTRHYFCGRDWHHASQSCHRHCPSGISSECGEGETCYADTPCDALMGLDGDNSSGDGKNDEDSTEMALTPRGTLPGIVTVWSDGSVSLHVITADVTSSSSGSSSGIGTNGDGKQQSQHRAKRGRQKNKKPELELRQLWRVYPLEPSSEDESSSGVHRKGGEGSVVYFDELGLTFESGAIYGVATTKTTASGSDGTKETKKARIGDHGAILLGGRYMLTSGGQQHPLKVSFHALDSLTGASLWELESNHSHGRKATDKNQKEVNDGPKIPIIHTTSSARRRSHLPTTDVMDPDLDNENGFIEGEDVMTSEECMTHFRASVLDGDSGALPHEYWGNAEEGSISVGRFDRKKRSGGKRGRSSVKKMKRIAHNKAGMTGGSQVDGGNPVRKHDGGGGKHAVVSSSRGGSGSSHSWQSDLIQRAVPRRLINKQKYNAKHPRMGKPNVVLFHGSDGVAVLSLKNGRPVCHISLVDHALYADLDQDGVIDIVQTVTSPEGFSKSSGVQSLIQRIAKTTEDRDERRGKPDAPVICHALVMSGLPPREEVFTAPLCLGGPLMSISPNRPQGGLSAAPPLLVEGSLGYGNDVIFAMNNGVVVRYDSNGREVWRKKGGLADGTPSWVSSGMAFLGRVEFGAVKESHTSVSASAHRNQHRPGSPARPILLSGEDGAAVISPASGRVLSSVVYPQSITSQPLLADCDGDGTEDLLVFSADAIWGYRIVVETGRSGFFSLVVVTVVIGVALAALVHKTSQPPGRLKRSMDA